MDITDNLDIPIITYETLSAYALLAAKHVAKSNDPMYSHDYLGGWTIEDLAQETVVRIFTGNSPDVPMNKSYVRQACSWTFHDRIRKVTGKHVEYEENKDSREAEETLDLDELGVILTQQEQETLDSLVTPGAKASHSISTQKRRIADLRYSIGKHLYE